MVYSVPDKRQRRKKHDSDMTRIVNALERIANTLEENNKQALKRPRKKEG